MLVLSLAYLFGAVVATEIPVAVGMAGNWDDEKKLAAIRPSTFAKPEAYTEPEVGAFPVVGASAVICGATVFVAACYDPEAAVVYLHGYSILAYPFALIWSRTLWNSF